MTSILLACVTFYVMPDYVLCKQKTGNQFSKCQQVQDGQVLQTSRVYIAPAYFETMKVCKK